LALNLGELSIGLELDNDRLRAGMAAAKRELESVPPVARREMVKVSRVMDEEGQRGGGLLAQGIRSGFIRRSPLIVAAVGGALAAGAPVMLAAAGTLFGGIGAVAAAQTLEVRSAWTEMGRDVRDSAVRDAAVLVPVYTQMAEQIGDAFQEMRPQLRDAFADSAPLIRSFTGGVIALAENAMPGLVRAAERGGPVFDGFESFLASTGTGLSDFFDAMSAHAPAAGEAFAALGDIMANLLPILGDLLGQGSELATIVLPPLAKVLGVLADAAASLGPLFPAIVTGFAAMKMAQSATVWVGSLADRMKALPASMSTMTSAMGPLGAAIAGAIVLYQNATSKGREWSEMLLEGGEAADTARAQMADFGTAYREVNSGWSGVLAGLVGGTATIAGTAIALDEAEQATKDFIASLDPLERAELRVTQAQSHLNQQIEEFGPGSDEAKGAARALKSAQNDLERQNGDLELAIHGVTSAMVDQADQALAMIDSGFAYRKSVDDLEDAQAELTETIKNRTNADKDLRTTEEDVARAQLALEEQSYKTALAFGQQQADLSGLSEDSLEYKRIVQEEMLGELHRLHDAAGPEMKAAIAQQIAALEASGVTMGENSAQAGALATKMRDLGLSVRQIPGQKFVQISAPTEDQRRRIAELGQAVHTLPNGQVIVYADTGPARREVANFIATQAARSIVLNVFGRSGAAAGGPIEGFASGGPVRGPGGPTDDLVPALAGATPFRLSNGEHVLTAREVQAAGGHGEIMEFRRALVSGARHAIGGPAGFPTSPAANALPMSRPVGGDRGPFMQVDKIEVIRGDADDVARQLELGARTRGHW
jgi:hypothetical protein